MLVKNSVISSSCSLLMAFIFAYSASVQLNDPDWYIWFPLYSAASGVNLFSLMSLCTMRTVAEATCTGGLLLLIKLLAEAFYMEGIKGILSLDMRERIVREKIGSLLVAATMFLQMKSHKISAENHKKFNITSQSATAIHYGMILLVALSIGLCLYFFIAVKADMKLEYM